MPGSIVKTHIAGLSDVFNSGMISENLILFYMTRAL
jgi:hypothetical protein